MRRLILGVAGVALLTAAGCASMDDKRSMEKTSLYQRLGGKDAITAVVNDFIGNVAADGRIKQRFQGANIPRLKGLLVDQICEATGGPCKYAGRSMLDAHRGMNITDREFGALVEDLAKTLDKFGVPTRETGELLAALAAMKGQIVGK